MKNIKYIMFGFFVIITIGVLVFANIYAPVTVQQQTIPSPTGNTNVIVKTCNSFPPISGNTLCQISTTQSVNTTINSPNCPNGGIAINGVCPISVTSLPSTTNPTTSNPITPPPNSEKIQLIPNIIIIDNFGKNYSQVQNSIPFYLASILNTKFSFISAGQNNTPIDHGKILFSIILQSAIPNEAIISSGIFYVSINGQQINPQGIKWGINGMTDSTGKITMNIATPLGTTNQYILDIASNAQNLQLPSNQLNFTTSNVSVKNGQGQSYSNPNIQILYQTILNYQANQILQKTSDGSFVPVYAGDDTLTLSSNYVQSMTNIGCVAYAKRCPMGTTITWFAPLPAGQATVYSEINGVESLIGTTPVVSTDVPSGSVPCYPNSAPYTPCNQVAPALNSASATISNIPRDSDIKIVITGGSSPFNQIIHTPLIQKSYTYTCTYNGCIFS